MVEVRVVPLGLIDEILDALVALANRATTPGAGKVPGDGTVTVFMSDCRKADTLAAALREVRDPPCRTIATEAEAGRGLNDIWPGDPI